MLARGWFTIYNDLISNGKRFSFRFEDDEAQQEQSRDIRDDAQVQDRCQTVGRSSGK